MLKKARWFTVLVAVILIAGLLSGSTLAEFGVTRVKENGNYEIVIIEDNTYLDNVVGEVGPTGPVISGETQQQPFLSKTAESGLGQPLIDKFAGVGMPVRATDNSTLSYSNYCSAPSMVAF